MLPPTTLPPAPTRSRLVHVDTLRVVLTLLVVAHHAAITYSSIPVWYYYEPRPDATAGLLDLFVVVNQMWFMGCFFLLSGLFVPASYDRKGAGRFTRDRLLRLGVPLVAYVIVLRPLAMLPGMLEQRSEAIAAGHDFSLITWYLTQGDPGPMWFVEVLLLFSLCYVGIRLITGERRPRPVPTLRLPWVGGLVLALSLLTFLWRILVPTETYWPVVGLPTPAYLPQYAMLFGAGVLIGRHGWLTALRARHGWIGLAMALIGLCVGLPLALIGGMDQVGGNGTAASAVLACSEALISVGMTMLLLVLFRRLRRGEAGAVHRFLSTHAFTVYIIHPVVLVGVALLLASVSGVAVAKFVLLFVMAVPICWGLAFLVRRLPRADRVL